MAISETLVQLVDIRDDIRQAIADKGVEMNGVPLSQYAEKIAGIGDFPGYKLKIGELCSIPATSGTNNGGLTRTLSVPAGCVPLCVKMEGGLSVYSGRGESPSYYLQVKDNNGKFYYYATRNGGSGSISSGSPSLYLNPLAAYDGDLEAASSITSVSITASNGSGNLISDYTQPKMSVTMWLEAL